MRAALTPARTAIAIVYEADRSVKLVAIEDSKLIGSASLSPSDTEASVHIANSRRRFGSHTAIANTVAATVSATTADRVFASDVRTPRIRSYLSFSARSMSCFTDSYGCAPESGYFFPLGAMTILHGVPLPPVAVAFCTLSSM